MQTVFITRDLDSNSIFLKKLYSDKYHVIGVSLLDFEPLIPTDIEVGDCYFFYSQQGFIFGKKYLQPHIPIAAIGKATAEFIRKQGFEVEFVGEGTNEEIAAKFLEKFSQKKVVFIRAKHSKHALLPYLIHKTFLSEMIVYENKIKENIAPIEADILVFTSSMNAEAYVKNNFKTDGKLVIAIGLPTAKTLNGLGISVSKLSDNPSESSLADAVLALTKS